MEYSSDRDKLKTKRDASANERLCEMECCHICSTSNKKFKRSYEKKGNEKIPVEIKPQLFLRRMSAANATALSKVRKHQQNMVSATTVK